MELEKVVFVYGLIDPFDKTVRYIGQTDNLKVRYSSHISNGRTSTHVSNAAWIKSLLERDAKPGLFIFEETTQPMSVKCEQKWIDFFKNTQPLTNLNKQSVSGIARYETVKAKNSLTPISQVAKEYGYASWIVAEVLKLNGFPYYLEHFDNEERWTYIYNDTTFYNKLVEYVKYTIMDAGSKNQVTLS